MELVRNNDPIFTLLVFTTSFNFQVMSKQEFQRNEGLNKGYFPLVENDGLNKTAKYYLFFESRNS